MLKLHEQIMFV